METSLSSSRTADIEDFPYSPISSFILNLIAFYLCAIMIASSIVNAFLFLIFIFVKELKSPINTFVFAITILNFLGTIIELPFVIGSNFACRFVSIYLKIRDNLINYFKFKMDFWTLWLSCFSVCNVFSRMYFSLLVSCCVA